MPKKIDKIIMPIAAVLNPFVTAPVNAYVLDHLVQYLDPDFEGNDAVYNIGLFVAFGAAVIQSMAMMYYQNEKNKRESGSHHHGFIHHAEHFLGLYLYNFCFGVGGVYYALLKDDTPEDDDERLKVSMLIAFASLIYTYVEAKIHETFLDEAEHQHGSLFQTMFKLLLKPKNLKEFWLSWGGLASHASAGYFGIRHAIDALGLLYFGKLPPAEIRDSISWIVGGIGAIVHTGSECTAVQKSPSILASYREIKEIDNKIKKFFVVLFLFACFVFMLYQKQLRSMKVPLIKMREKRSVL